MGAHMGLLRNKVNKTSRNLGKDVQKTIEDMFTFQTVIGVLCEEISHRPRSLPTGEFELSTMLSQTFESNLKYLEQPRAGCPIWTRVRAGESQLNRAVLGYFKALVQEAKNPRLADYHVPCPTCYDRDLSHSLVVESIQTVVPVKPIAEHIASYLPDLPCYACGEGLGVPKRMLTVFGKFEAEVEKRGGLARLPIELKRLCYEMADAKRSFFAHNYTTAQKGSCKVLGQTAKVWGERYEAIQAEINGPMRVHGWHPSPNWPFPTDFTPRSVDGLDEPRRLGGADTDLKTALLCVFATPVLILLLLLLWRCFWKRSTEDGAQGSLPARAPDLRDVGLQVDVSRWGEATDIPVRTSVG